MKRLKLLIPVLAVFLSPWAHWLVYHNLLLAWPEMDHGMAHFTAIMAAVFAGGAIAMMMEA